MKAFLGRDTITILKADLANPVKYVQVLVFTIITAMPLGSFRRTWSGVGGGGGKSAPLSFSISVIKKIGSFLGIEGGDNHTQNSY